MTTEPPSSTNASLPPITSPFPTLPSLGHPPTLTTEESTLLPLFRASIDKKCSEWMSLPNDQKTYTFPPNCPKELQRHWSYCLDHNDKSHVPYIYMDGKISTAPSPLSSSASLHISLPLIFGDWKDFHDSGPSSIPFTTRLPDHVILRFLRARKHKIDLALTHIWEYLQFRSHFHVDHLVLYEEMPCWSLLKALVMHSYHKYDKHGRPMYIEKTGSLIPSDFMYYVTYSKVMYTHVWMMMRMERNCHESSLINKDNKRIDTIVSILDFKNFTLAFLKTIKFFKATSYIDQTYFPEMLGNLILVNAPSTFSSVWSLVKPFLDPVTQQKMKIWNHHYHAKLHEELGKETLPKEYGGDCECKEREGGCVAPLGPFPPYMKPPNDLVEITVKAGKKMVAEEINILDEINKNDKEKQKDEKYDPNALTPSLLSFPLVVSWQLQVISKDVTVNIYFINEGSEENKNKMKKEEEEREKRKKIEGTVEIGKDKGEESKEAEESSDNVPSNSPFSPASSYSSPLSNQIPSPTSSSSSSLSPASPSSSATSSSSSPSPNIIIPSPSSPSVTLFSSKLSSTQPFTSGSVQLSSWAKGKIVVEFDNAYSYFTSKEVKYKVRVKRED